MGAVVASKTSTQHAMGYAVFVHTSARTGERTAFLAPPEYDPDRPRSLARVTAQAFDVLREVAQANNCERLFVDGPDGWEEVTL